MTTENFLTQLRNHLDKVSFDDVIQYIDKQYQYIPSRFTNGIDNDVIINEAGKNEGSCKIFAFGLMQGLSETETLACFGKYYRDDVLNDPTGTNHLNIRTFMKHGWQGIHFDSDALILK